MFWIIDLIIVGLLALLVFLGYKKGLAKCAIKLLSTVIALVLALILFKPVSNWVINNTEIDDNIKSSITQIIQKDVEEDGEVKDDTNLPETMVEHINEQIKTNVNNTKEAVVDTASTEVSLIAVKVLVGFGIFIAVKIVLLIVLAIFSVITELPVIKQIDKAGGIVYGILETAVIVFVVFGIISAISPMIESTGLIEMINKSIIGSVLYNNNILMKIIF